MMDYATQRPPFPGSTLLYAKQWQVCVFVFVARKGRAGASFDDVARHCAKSSSWAREALNAMWKHGYLRRRVARELPGAPVRFYVLTKLAGELEKGEAE